MVEEFAMEGEDAKDSIAEPEKAIFAAENFEGDGDDDDTATESYDYDGESGDEENSQYSYDDDNDGRPLPMPPLKYARIMGSLPRDNAEYFPALSVKITSSAMGRVVVRPPLYPEKNHESQTLSGAKNGESNLEWAEYDDDDEVDISLTKICHVIALGFEDGKVRLVDALTGGSVLFGSSSGDGGAWFVNPSSTKRGEDSGCKIVALCFDSSSSHLSALNANGDAAVFGPLEWGKQSRRRKSLVSRAGEGQQKFGFLFGGKEPHSTIASDSIFSLRPPYSLSKPATSARFTYADPQSFGSSLLGGGSSGPEQGYRPSCMALDPSYGRKKERALVVGFDDGRLILSKLQGATRIGFTSFLGGGASSNAAGGGTAVKKIDLVLYQGMGATSFSGDQAGIEAVTWRGGLIAWADSSGVRLFDIESMSRIAHIDRPTGARSTLYPTISSSLRPSILFERSDLLLIGWGDCLMGMLVRDAERSTAATKDGAPTKEVKRKTVTVTMAWELDCVACSVVPVDEKHVAVLGLIPSPSSLVDVDASEPNVKSSRDASAAGGDNVLELQIINRVDGSSISNDRLPLLEGPGRSQIDGRITTANATDFCLLSSFACPKMDDMAEWEALDDTEKGAIGRVMSNIGSQSTSAKKVPDLHMEWNLDGDICSVGNEIQSEAKNYDDQSVSSNCSIMSDNYVFVLSEPIGDLMPDSALISRASPPIMTAIYSYDLCLVQSRDVDDVVSYTRSLGKPSLALKQALAHRREVKRHGLDQLVDEYFVALLRMRSNGEGKALSFSRLKIATESLPILLGGDPRMWQRWIFMFSKIPGGLFAVREKIPVRDPDLPAFVFEMSLEKMLEDTLSNSHEGNNGRRDESQHDKEYLVGEKMADLFLETMRSWGPTSSLRRRIQLHRYCAQNQQWGLQWHSLSGSSAVVPFIRQAEKDLHRRISQTAFGVLSNAHHSPSLTQNNSIRQHIDSSKDSLFGVEHLIARITARFQLNSSDKSGILADYDTSSKIVLGTMKHNYAVVIESMAELELMRERFDRALGYYLTIGSEFMVDALSSLEDMAVQSVNSFCQSNSFTITEQTEVENFKYSHVLSLIELHQLTHILLKRNVVFVHKKGVSKAESPIVALIMLVGLSRAGRFLIDHCSPPEGTVTQINSDENGVSFSGSNLPLDLVANQMKSRPKLLYWFLFQVFIHKPDIYVKFPTTAVPPPPITDLHRLQFSLFVDYADEDDAENDQRNQSPAGLIVDKDTPFMAFLRAVTKVGGIQADNIREKLEAYRGGGTDSPAFARELAFIIEHFGTGTIEDAKQVLHLYLRGAKNLHMAVAFAERNEFSNVLWDMLVEHATPDPSSDADQNSAFGALFGSLLEAAAHTGSDLSSLVSRIPEGMSIEGLRPKLISAITDYHYKVKIHEHVNSMLVDDKISVLRELNHMLRRGKRMESEEREAQQNDKPPANSTSVSSRDLIKSRRLRFPSGHRSHSFSLPIR